MLIGWYKYDASDPVGHGIVGYFLAPAVGKSVEGQRLQLKREPAPELLAGDPEQILRFLKRLTFKRRFSAMTMTFAEDDVPVAAFNRDALRAGDAEAAEIAMRSHITQAKNRMFVGKIGSTNQS